MDIDEDLVKLLAELAFIAGDHGMVEHANSIVAALSVLRPGSERPFLIQAWVRLSQGDAPGAEQALRERALKANPGSAAALACLGVVLHQQRRIGERDRVLQEVLSSRDDDEDAMRLARTLLEARPD